MQVNLAEYNPKDHRDYMSSLIEGGIEIKKTHLIKGIAYVFTLEIGKNCLVFKDVERLKEAKSFFEKIIRPSTIGNPPLYEHHWDIWYGRLPKNVLKDSTRERILKAINKAIIQYEDTAFKKVIKRNFANRVNFMDELVSAFEEIIDLLDKSEDTIRANYTVEEAREILQTELEIYKQTRELSESGKYRINFLFLPTSALQEISIDNGWGDKYVEIADIFDKYL